MAALEAVRENSNSFFSNLVNFYVDSVSTCFSLDADKLCMSIGLSCIYALLSLLSCFLLMYRRCTYRKENPGGKLTSFYSFVGNLCSTVGASLSSQLFILISMSAFAAAVDVVHIVSCCFHLCLNSHAEKRQRMMKSRRRQLLLSMSVLFVVGGGILKPWVIHHSAENALSRRKLLQVSLQDSTETLGYMLGLLSFVISCTSRLPAFSREHRGQMTTWGYTFSGLLSALAGAFYATAVLLSDTRFVWKALPWLLSAFFCVVLDLLILIIYWCKRGTQQQNNFSPDRESLLGCTSLFTDDISVTKKHRKQHIHSSAQTKTKNALQTTEMGHYMDVQSAEKTCFQVETLSKGETEYQPLHGAVRVIRFNSFCSSDSMCDSSLESSDLEWDFEEANAQWNQPTSELLDKVKFSLQEWHQKPYNSCICAMFGPQQRTLPGGDYNK